jgi:hypothetical protein
MGDFIMASVKMPKKVDVAQWDIYDLDGTVDDLMAKLAKLKAEYPNHELKVDADCVDQLYIDNGVTAKITIFYLDHS